MLASTHSSTATATATAPAADTDTANTTPGIACTMIGGKQQRGLVRHFPPLSSLSVLLLETLFQRTGCFAANASAMVAWAMGLRPPC